MKVVGIIAEFNPFHNGHQYLIDKAKELTNADYVIVIMSGSFTQSGNIAIYDKFKRAKSSVINGADMVIELPSVYAISSSKYFATGAIDLLNKLNIVDYVCFGSECGDIQILENIVNKELANENDITEKIKEEMKKGVTYAKARESALISYLNNDEMSELSKSNNILAIEYLKAIKNLNSNMKAVTIKRNKQYVSATEIRKKIYDTTNEDLDKYVPNNTLEIIKNSNYLSNENLFYILKYTIINNMENLKHINEINEGLENRIIDKINDSKSYEEFVQNIKCKRYLLSNIKRITLNILLNISKPDFNKLYLNLNYAHILSLSEKGKKLLSQISKNSNINVITKINEKVINELNDIDKKSLFLDIKASNLHSILLNENIQKDYTNKL